MKAKHIFLWIAMAAPTFAFAALPKERSDMRAGNKAYKSNDFSAAEIEYRRALDKVPDCANAKFNLGNALLKQLDTTKIKSDPEGAKKQLEQARSYYEEVAETSTDNVQKAQAFYNAGNTYLAEQNFKEAVEQYKKSLRLNPSDLQAKQNLVFAQAMQNQQQQQQQQQQQNKNDKNQDKNKDDKQQQQQNQDQNKDQQNQDKQNQDQQNQDKQNQDKDKQQQPNDEQGEGEERQAKISKEDAQRMLQALEQQEKDTQDKVKKEKAAKAKQRRTDKNW